MSLTKLRLETLSCLCWCRKTPGNTATRRTSLTEFPRSVATHLLRLLAPAIRSSISVDIIGGRVATQTWVEIARFQHKVIELTGQASYWQKKLCATTWQLLPKAAALPDTAASSDVFLEGALDHAVSFWLLKLSTSKSTALQICFNQGETGTGNCHSLHDSVVFPPSSYVFFSGCLSCRALTSRATSSKVWKLRGKRWPDHLELRPKWQLNLDVIRIQMRRVNW